MSIEEEKVIGLPVYKTGNYLDTKEGQDAKEEVNRAQGVVTGYGGFAYGRQDQLDAIMDSILNRKPFSYNFNEDALYHQYKDKYIKQGKMASADVMGQAAAMTGGYGNSYAVTAGNQAYLAHLENLNDIIPELYQMAYERYKGEGDELTQKYGVLSDDYNRQYGKHMDGYSMAKDALAVAQNAYDSGYSNFYNDQDRANALIAQEFEDALALAEHEAKYPSTVVDSNTVDPHLVDDIIADPQGEQEESAADYADWDYGDWEGYFAIIRNTEGKSAAEEELSRMNKEGFIPTEFFVPARLGASGSLGH